MNPWTNAFLEVWHSSRQFALAWDENETCKRSLAYRTLWVMRQDKSLAVARGKIEMAIAVYKVEARLGRKEA